MELTIDQIAEFLGGVVEGNGNVKITALAKIQHAVEGEVTFLANPKYTPFVYSTQASVVVVNNDFSPEKEIKANIIRVEDAYSSFTKLLTKFSSTQTFVEGISDKATIHETAKIGNNVVIGDYSYIGPGVTIGDNTIIHTNVSIYPNVTIKNDCFIYAGVIVMENCIVGNNCLLQPGAVVGCDGFGFAPEKDGTFSKIPQTGNVVLEDNVEIGTNATIDRATMGSTLIRKGSKIDNLIQIGHNCDIGENCVIAGQSGVAGSTVLGHNVMIGGQSGVVGHLKIGNNVKIAARSGVLSNIKDDNFFMGFPAFNIRDFKRSTVHFKNLESIVSKISDLEKRLKEFEDKKN